MATVSTNAAGITGINMKKHSIVKKINIKNNNIESEKSVETTYDDDSDAE
jgi:hypothetical protein